MVASKILQVFVASIYMSLLLLVYVVFIAERWSNMGFEAIGSGLDVTLAFLISAATAMALPGASDTRGILITSIFYLFFIPSLVISASTGFDLQYFLAVFIASCIVILFSLYPLRALRVKRVSGRLIAAVTGLVVFGSISAMAASGGFVHFNLDLLSVYDFRRAASAEMPQIFGYIFSGVSKVVAPILLIFALRLRSPLLFVLSCAAVLILFGMTSHKSVLFLPVFTVVCYLFLERARAKGLWLILLLFLSIPAISALEVAYAALIDPSYPALFTSFIVRRALFIPAYLDQAYIDFFSGVEKYYWSQSRISFGLVDQPYDVGAPRLIGREVFDRPEMSANAGMIGSGFSNAGYMGVAVYAMFVGLLISFLQAAGKIVGHALASAVSLSMVLTIVTSTDLVTAILSHGLLVLLAFLAVFPEDTKRRSSPQMIAR